MCVKLPLGDLNPGPCLPHLTSTYTCKVTTAPRVRSGEIIVNLIPCDHLISHLNFHILDSHLLEVYVAHMQKGSVRLNKSIHNNGTLNT